MFCHKCGNKLPEGAMFCQKCGAKVLHEDTIQQSAAEASMGDNRSKKDEEMPQTTAESSPVHDLKGDSFEAPKHFKEFVENHIREVTQFQTTEELLNSQVPLPFVKKNLRTFAILGTLLGILLCTYGYVSGNTNLTDTMNLFIILVIVIFALAIGWAVAIFKSLIMEGQYASKYDGKFEGNINTEDLIQFLNEYLSYISPYFHQWGYITRSAFGMQGLMKTTLEDSMQKAMKEIRICTEFGKQKRQLSVIVLRPDPLNTDLGYMEYFASAENRSEGYISSLVAVFHNDYGFEKYKCVVRTAPILQAAMEYYLKVYKTDGGKETTAYRGNAVEQEKRVPQKENTDEQQAETDVVAEAIDQQTHGVQEKNPARKKSKKLPIILGIAGFAVIFAIIIAKNWEGKVDYIATVKAHTPFAVSQGLPYTYEEVLNKYFDPLEWEVREEGGIHYVDISGEAKGMDSAFALTVKVSSNPDIPDGALMEPISVMLGDRQSGVEDEVARVLYNLFCAYDEGYEIGGESLGGHEEQGFASINEDFYTEYEMAARPVIVDWFERHPLKGQIRIRFANELTYAGESGEKYLLYEIYWISGEKYGTFFVNPDNGDMVMDSVMDSNGKWSSIQESMDQWYLEYYWGWTDNSGYYMENYSEDCTIIYDETDAEILEYSPNYDSYVICNFDGQWFIEYDDGSAASEISIADFAGAYGYDASFEEEGESLNFYYYLEIGEWNSYWFSISEEWRGNSIIQDEYARPKSLIVDTLTFDTIAADGLGIETHTLTYIPAYNSPLGQDVIYIDGDEDMPFARE